jgi:hypothetical protein
MDSGQWSTVVIPAFNTVIPAPRSLGEVGSFLRRQESSCVIASEAKQPRFVIASLPAGGRSNLSHKDEIATSTSPRATQIYDLLKG